jgi:hypothetical protein
VIAECYSLLCERWNDDKRIRRLIMNAERKLQLHSGIALNAFTKDLSCATYESC